MATERDLVSESAGTLARLAEVLGWPEFLRALRAAEAPGRTAAQLRAAVDAGERMARAVGGDPAFTRAVADALRLLRAALEELARLER
jgi:hypothetical protein